METGGSVRKTIAWLVHLRRRSVLGGGGRRRALALGTACLLPWLLVSPAAAAAPQEAPAPSAQQGSVTLTADHIQYNTQTGDLAADGHVRAVRGDTTITADRLRGNLQVGEVEASGNVVLLEGRRTVTGTFLRYNYKTRLGRMDQGVSQFGPWNVKAKELDFNAAANNGTAYAGALTPCDPQHPAFLITATRAFIVPGEYITAYDASLWVFGVRVVTIPQFTASLKGGKSGPLAGFNKLDGVWVEYDQSLPLGDVWSQLRVRYATLSGWSGEGIFGIHVADHTLDVALGRTQFFDLNGNLFNIDRYQAEIVYDGHPIPGTPLTYSLEGRYGNYFESASNVSTSRGEAILNLMSDTFLITPRASWSFSATARYDAYGTGDVRSILGGSAAGTYDLRGGQALTLSYNFESVAGKTPFSFDSIGPDSTVTLTYSLWTPGVLQNGTVYVQYGFITQQTTIGPSFLLAISPSILFSMSGSYNVSTQKWNEIDYSVRATCDCLTLGVLYQTFPTNPSQNAWWITLGISTVPETFNTFKF